MTINQKRSILLIGTGGHARACIDVIEGQGEYAIVGLVGTKADLQNEILGYPVVGTDEELEPLLRQHGGGLVCIGQILTSELRQKMFTILEKSGGALNAIISPRAYVSAHANLGHGTIVLHGAVVNAGARVGRNCIVNSMALIEHDSEIGDHCHVSTGARINGNVSVGSGSFIGSGAIIRQGVKIGAGAVIGMGARVKRDCAHGEIVKDAN